MNDWGCAFSLQVMIMWFFLLLSREYFDFRYWEWKRVDFGHLTWWVFFLAVEISFWVFWHLFVWCICIEATWLIRSYVTWHMQICDMTNSFTVTWCIRSYVTRLIHVWHVSLMCDIAHLCTGLKALFPTDQIKERLEGSPQLPISSLAFATLASFNSKYAYKEKESQTRVIYLLAICVLLLSPPSTISVHTKRESHNIKSSIHHNVESSIHHNVESFIHHNDESSVHHNLESSIHHELWVI